MMKKMLKQILSIIIAHSFLFQLFFSTFSLALTSGPGTPEFSTFEPVSAKDMVNEFTGDFAYSLNLMTVPGPNGSSYPITLSYSSDIKPEMEASWVGLGWNLGPGAINRQKRGMADDWNGEKVRYHQKQNRVFTESWTIQTGVGYSVLDLNGGITLGYNSARGYNLSPGIGLSICGAGANYKRSIFDESGSFSLDFNPYAIASLIASQASKNSNKNTTTNANITDSRTYKYLKGQCEGQWKKRISPALSARIGVSSGSGFLGVEHIAFPFVMPKYKKSQNFQYNISTSASAYGWVWSAGDMASYTYYDYEDYQDKNSYGLLYTHNANTDNGEVMDYYSEKNFSFQKDDNLLPLPIANKDIFSVSCPGLSGNFGIFMKSNGHFSTASVTNTTEISSEGTSLGYPSIIGTSTGSGSTISSIGSWETPDGYKYTGERDEDYYMMFYNDLSTNVSLNEYYDLEGDNIDASEDQMIVQAALIAEYEEINDHSAEQVLDNADYLINNHQNFSFEIPENLPATLNEGKRVKRASYIGFHTNEEILKGLGYNSNEAFASHVSRYQNSDGLGEIVIYNESGLRYNFGVPVYISNETSLSYGLDKSDQPAYDAESDWYENSSTIENNYLVYKDISNTSDIDKINGMETFGSYASSFLLTDITGTDYIDRTNDGITSDDFGGWTKFNYTKVHGTVYNENGDGTASSIASTPEYQWRIPYNGLLYDKGELSNAGDDRGTVVFGTKEIYNLESIETPSHIALFTCKERPDGKSSASNENAAKSSTAHGDQSISMLEKIELFTKDANGNPNQLIHTVKFQYDFSLQQNIPNFKATSETFNNELGTGKLTLKKVWHEYEGIKNSTIAPYIFSYDYKDKNDYPQHVQDLYPDITSYGEKLEQNPEYSIYNSDAWGYHCENGENKKSDLVNSVEQNPAETLDPAAWCLKGISLPTGGEILLQYEQDDYQYVQNFPAFNMVPLKDVNGSKNRDVSDESDDNIYYLDLEAIGIDENDLDMLAAYSFHLENYLLGITTSYVMNGTNPKEYNQGANRIYAKFLYDLTGGSNPDVNNCGSEYISGYLGNEFGNIGYDENGVWIYLPSTDYGSSMREVCQDYVKQNRGKITNSDCQAEKLHQDPLELTENNDDNWKIRNAIFFDLVAPSITSLIDPTPFDFIANIYEDDNINGCDFPFTKNNFENDNVISAIKDCFLGEETPYALAVEPSKSFCKTLNLEKSYLRLPVLDNKLGGGIRVKRLMTYDAGINGNEQDAMLYGKEYIYELEDGTSSGVASNEPESIREENGLIQLVNIANDPNSFLENTLVLGKDKRQVDGTVGESLLPSASVGYSRIVSKNIYEGINNNGFAVSEFYTAYDYPTISTLISNVNYEDYNPDLPLTFEDLLHGSLTYNTLSAIEEASADPLKDVALSLASTFTLSLPAGPIIMVAFNLADIKEWIIDGTGPVKQFKNNLSSISDGIKEARSIMENDELAAYFSENDYEEITEVIDSYNEFINEVNNIEGNVSIANLYSTCVSLGNLMQEVKNFIPESFQNVIDIYSQGISQHSYMQIWATQGYVIQMNDMHGKPKMTSSYEGNYVEITTLDDARKVSETTYNYYTDEELKARFSSNELSESFAAYRPGRTQELYMETKSVKTEMEQEIDAEGLFANIGEDIFSSMGVDLDFGMKTVIASTEELHTHVCTRIIRNAAVLKSIVTDMEGVENIASNVVYDQITGMPFVVQSKDGFDGLLLEGDENNELHNGTYTQYTFNAPTQYTAMGQKAANEGFTYLTNETDLSLRYKYNSGDCYIRVLPKGDNSNTEDVTEYIHSGDQLVLSNGSGSVMYAHVKEVDGRLIYLYPIGEAINTDGRVDLHVLASSYTNQLKAPIGNITTYGESAITDFYELGENIMLSKNITKYDAVTNVINASAITLGDNWELTDKLKDVYNITSNDTNPYLNAEQGKWRMKGTYVYNTEIKGGAQDENGERVYNAGMAEYVPLFNWESPDDNYENWKPVTTSSKYSPMGNLLEESNIIDVYSNAHFGYNHSVPYIIANNAKYQTCFFESFESVSEERITMASLTDGIKTYIEGEDGHLISIAEPNGEVTIDNSTAHSGSQSVKLEVRENITIMDCSGTPCENLYPPHDFMDEYGVIDEAAWLSAIDKCRENGEDLPDPDCDPSVSVYEGELSLKSIKVNEQLRNVGLLVNFWLKSNDLENNLNVTVIDTSNNFTDVTSKKIAKTGEWELYEAYVSLEDVSKETYIYPQLQVTSNNNEIWLDDIRFLPFDAEAVCYVYDPNTLRLLTQFDSQHFGLYYQYNAEGKLIRKKVETERGIKTIQEAHYNIPGIDREFEFESDYMYIVPGVSIDDPILNDAANPIEINTSLPGIDDLISPEYDIESQLAEELIFVEQYDKLKTSSPDWTSVIIEEYTYFLLSNGSIYTTEENALTAFYSYYTSAYPDETIGSLTEVETVVNDYANTYNSSILNSYLK